MYVVGTAGHVDHGKSTLVQALTGIDPDRLREEKERGLTIDLGFAWLTLPSGREVSVVDVPGHERFIKNMLAGAGGVDLALLVVAADEGPMPQTREHLAILDLLDVPAGLVVLTKCDLVEDEYADLVEAELEDALAGTMLAGAPVVRVSATTGAGLVALLAAIDAALESRPTKRDLGRPRLPIDRAFTVQGFGTVVTGTLVDGALVVGQEVELQPGGRKARVRGLQRHRTKVQRLEPGTRAAVNISGVHAEDVTRGMVLAAPGVVAPVRAVDVRFRATRLLEHPLAHDAGVTFLSATSETEARIRFLETESVAAGEEAWAQLVFADDVAVARGDRCVVRTSNETAGGGVIVAVNPRRHRRRHAPVLRALERLLVGSPEERLLDALASGPMETRSVGQRLGIEGDAALELITGLQSAGQALVAATRLYSVQWLNAASGRLTNDVEAYLASNPLRFAMPREHVRSASGLDAPAFDAVVSTAVAAGVLEERTAGLAPPAYEAAVSAAQELAINRYLASLQAGRFSPPTDAPPEPSLLAYLVESNRVVDTGAGVVFDAVVFEEMVASLRSEVGFDGTVTLAQVRDLFGTSRKYAQAFLEYLDVRRITRRVGDARIFRGSDAP
ncbi:MAG: selenocysteine-specific translation elongation factor [Dehalococcoidia bacterium]